MLRACGLATPEVISQIFQWAHEADPTAILVRHTPYHTSNSTQAPKTQ
jgi:GH35 family endo-1,4-beta-xylanase